MPRAKPVTAPRFVFVDLDLLLASVRDHVLRHEAHFHAQLAQFSAAVALDPQKLTVLLNDQHPASVQCRRGTYCNPNQTEAKALEALKTADGQKVQWQLTQKGTAEHPTLEKMLRRQLKGAKGTLVLATGTLSKSMQSVLDAFLKAKWHVQIVCLDNCWQRSGYRENEGLHRSLDKYLKKLLSGTHDAASPRPFERRASSPSLKPEQGSPTKAFAPLELHQVERRAGMLEQELGDIERRTTRLAALPSGKYAAASRNRFVYMNLDNIAGAVCNSQGLYQRIQGAASGYDVRLNFRALTDRVCGPKPSLVKKRVVAYRKMPRELALPLQEFDWEIQPLSQSSSGNKGLYYVLLDLLETISAAKHKNTLVLVMGDGCLGGSGVEQKEATRELFNRFLDKNWFVEIHSWLHALSDWFLDMQEQAQYRVAVKPLDDAIHELVYLKDEEEDVWVEPVWHDPSGRCRQVEAPVLGSAYSPPSAWGATAIPAVSLFPTAPLLTLEQKLEQREKLEAERRDLYERLRKNQEALDALEMETWPMQLLQQQELSRAAQQASDKQLAIRMAQEEEMQLRFLDRYEETQEEEPWQTA